MIKYAINKERPKKRERKRAEQNMRTRIGEKTKKERGKEPGMMDGFKNKNGLTDFNCKVKENLENKIDAASTQDLCASK